MTQQSSECFEWQRAEVKWTRAGYELSVPTVKELTDRQALAVDNAVGSKLVRTVSSDLNVSIHFLTLTAQHLNAIDPIQFRRDVEQIASDALAELAQRVAEERGVYGPWTNRIRFGDTDS